MAEHKINDIFIMFDKTREKIEIKLDELKSNLGNLKNKIVLYGAGSAGIAFLHYLRDVDIFPVYFSDGNHKNGDKNARVLK